MKKERGPEYYDKLYKESNKHENRIEKYSEMWNFIAKILHKQNILDIGCGPGDFAYFLTKLSDIRIESYKGLDFSETAIHKANYKINNENFSFEQYDVYQGLYDNFDIYIFMDVLEHLDKDKKVLNFVPKNKEIVMTLPIFDAPAHVRIYKNKKVIHNRYNDIVDIKLIKKFNRLFIVYGNKK